MRFRLIQLVFLLLCFALLATAEPLVAVASSNFGSLLLLREMGGNLSFQNRAMISCGEEVDLVQARNALTWAVTIQPEHVSTYVMLGRLERWVNCPDQARTWLEQGSRYTPNDIMLVWQLGETYSERGDLATAARIWRASPAVLQGFIWSGDRVAFGQDWTKAELEFRRALAIDSRSAAANWGLGGVLYGQGRFDEAIETFSVARTLGVPRDAYKIVQFAHVLDMRGRNTEAVRMLDEFNLMGPLADAIRGSFYRSVGDLDKAAYYLESSIRQQPNDPWARHALAIVYARLGRKAQATDQLQALLESNSQFQAARDLLGCLSTTENSRQCVTP